MMDKIKIYTTLQEIAKKITNGNDVEGIDDIVNDIWLQLIEDSRTEGLQERGQLNFFCARILMNQICSNRSTLYTKYQHYHGDGISKNVIKAWKETIDSDYLQDILEDFTVTTQEDDDEMLIYKRRLSELPYQDKVVFCLYAKNGSVYRTAKYFNIRQKEVREILARVKEELSK